MGNKFALFKIKPNAKTANLHGREIPDFSDPKATVGHTGFRIMNEDISDVDLSNAGDKLPYIRFDNRVVFPATDKLPAGFNPTRVFEDGKDPGLRIKELHKRGITGRGIRVAIIDQPLDTEHIEYKDNLIHYEQIGHDDKEMVSMHGPAVASLLCGKTTGVAPDIQLIYFAANNLKPADDKDQPLPGNSERKVYAGNYAKALRKILFMNTALPDGEKIDAVSISWGQLHDNPETSDLLRKLAESGVMVLTTDSKRTYGKDARFTTIDRQMNADADNPESYDPGFWRDFKDYAPEQILVPAGGRTIAGFGGHDNYVYYGANSGMSWATPYLVGVYALAKQTNPQLTPQKFFELAHQTGSAMNINDVQRGLIIQPQKIIEALQREMLLQKQMAGHGME
ncbi:MAG: S8/S53 family peptidase [Alphaproteobacteria bacterium]|nr:S8/S53 family peptidase [Alphaproteobacteria bacterium]